MRLLGSQRGARRFILSQGNQSVRVWDLTGDREQARLIADAAVQAVAVIAGDTAGQVHALQLNVPALASI